MNKIEDIIELLPFWKSLSQTEKDVVRSSSVIKTYSKGQFIHGGGNECLGMIMLISGSIRTLIISEEGREITLFRLHEGNVCVMSASCVMSQITFETSMMAEQDVEMMIIGSHIFGKLAEENIYVRCFMYELMMERFSNVMWTMQEILFKGFDRRLASFLVNEADRTGSQEIRMTHEQIAQQISSAREVVARMLKRFEADGLVEYKRGLIKLKDIDSLRLMM